jgi:predicted RNA-binding protein (virulence factor B family)
VAKLYDVDSRISEFIYSSVETKPKPDYQVGKWIRVRVTRLMDYGVFVTTMDKHAASGLIHKRHIPEGLELQFGQVLEAKVKEVKSDGKVEFRLDDEELTQEAFAELETLKEQLPEKLQRPFFPDDVKEIIAFLSKEFGIVSEEAKKKVEELIRERGVFRFTYAMMKTLPVFQRDLVYHFLKEVEQARDDL